MVDIGFGAEIRAARTARGMSQGSLAAQLGVSQGHISNIERGKVVDLATSRRAFGALGIDPQTVMMKDAGMSEAEIAIMNDPALRTDDRAPLLEIYRVFRRRGPLGEAA